MLIFFAVFGLFFIAVIAFQVFLWWRVFSKAGFSGAFAFLLFVPGVGMLIMLCILAFSNWPVFNKPQSAPDVPIEKPGL
jgi:uncharacterized membrane protein YhaH (DUF805 family)